MFKLLFSLWHYYTLLSFIYLLRPPWYCLTLAGTLLSQDKSLPCPPAFMSLMFSCLPLGKKKDFFLFMCLCLCMCHTHVCLNVTEEGVRPQVDRLQTFVSLLKWVLGESKFWSDGRATVALTVVSPTLSHLFPPFHGPLYSIMIKKHTHSNVCAWCIHINIKWVGSWEKERQAVRQNGREKRYFNSLD